MGDIEDITSIFCAYKDTKPSPHAMNTISGEEFCRCTIESANDVETVEVNSVSLSLD